jgi:hypothetical protein
MKVLFTFVSEITVMILLGFGLAMILGKDHGDGLFFATNGICFLLGRWWMIVRVAHAETMKAMK